MKVAMETVTIVFQTNGIHIKRDVSKEECDRIVRFILSELMIAQAVREQVSDEKGIP